MALTAPTGITVTASASGNVIAWTAGTDAVYTKIYRAERWDGIYTEIIAQLAAATVTLTDASGIETSCYKLSSVGSGGFETELTEYYTLSTNTQYPQIGKLSSVSHCGFYMWGTNYTTYTSENYEIHRLISSVSQKIERYLKRKILTEKRTEYISLTPGQYAIYPGAYPINYVQYLHHDLSGEYNGDETAINYDEFIVSNDGRYIVLGYEYNTAPNGIRLVYNAGLAESAVNTRVKGTIAATAWTVGRYVLGGTSGALGILRVTETAGTSKYQTIEQLHGIFLAGETLTESSTIGGAATTGVSTIIDKIVYQSLAESKGTDLVSACEKQIMFELKHKQDSWSGSITKDGVTMTFPYKDELIPEVMAMLEPFVNRVI